MKVLVAILLIVPLPLLAQTDITAHHSMIKGLISYRNELIARNPEAFQRMWQMEQLWNEPDQESVSDYVMNVVFANQLYGMSPEKILKKYLKYQPDFKLTHLLKEENLQAILENHAWMALLVNGYLKPTPPFVIDAETGLFEELSFYKIRNGMRVAELGAGDGTFSLMLGLAFDSLQVYVNEINPDAVKYSSLSIKACESCRPTNQFYHILGRKKSTGLEGVQLDKIVIRNAFHHFSSQQAMLAAIRQSLMPDGDLYITDPTLQPDKAPECDKVMSMEALRAVIEANGFKIIEEKQLMDWSWTMLHCKPSTP